MNKIDTINTNDLDVFSIIRTLIKEKYQILAYTFIIMLPIIAYSVFVLANNEARINAVSFVTVLNVSKVNSQFGGFEISNEQKNRAIKTVLKNNIYAYENTLENTIKLNKSIITYSGSVILNSELNNLLDNPKEYFNNMFITDDNIKSVLQEMDLVNKNFASIRFVTANNDVPFEIAREIMNELIVILNKDYLNLITSEISNTYFAPPSMSIIQNTDESVYYEYFTAYFNELNVELEIFKEHILSGFKDNSYELVKLNRHQLDLARLHDIFTNSLNQFNHTRLLKKRQNSLQEKIILTEKNMKILKELMNRNIIFTENLIRDEKNEFKNNDAIIQVLVKENNTLENKFIELFDQLENYEFEIVDIRDDITESAFIKENNNIVEREYFYTEIVNLTKNVNQSLINISKNKFANEMITVSLPINTESQKRFSAINNIYLLILSFISLCLASCFILIKDQYYSKYNDLLYIEPHSK